MPPSKKRVPLLPDKTKQYHSFKSERDELSSITHQYETEDLCSKIERQENRGYPSMKEILTFRICGRDEHILQSLPRKLPH